MKVPLSSISISGVEQKAVGDAIEAGLLSSSVPAVGEFEAAIAESVGRRFAVATNSGTSALELALIGMGVRPGDEVIVPAFTFAAPALAASRVGARPVFADVTDAWTIDPESIDRLKTHRTRAVIAVDVLGHPCDYDALNDLGVPILEDAAEAFGARYRGTPTGKFGDAAVFSFHANKVISSGEGGCVVCDDPSLDARLRQLNAFGMDPERRYWHTLPGCNFRMSGLVASVALSQLRRADELLAGRRRVAERYDAAIAGTPYARRPVAAWADESVWLYTLTCDDRQSVLERCRAAGVDARAVWPVLPENPVFRDCVAEPCPRAESIAARAFWLPTFSDMSQEQCDIVIDAVLGAARQSS